jgi:putative beta-lysine N-acetyltransferase
MPDELIQIGDSTVQHGPHSDRVYAISLSSKDMPDILDVLDEMAKAEAYGKVIAKANRKHFEEFFARGYHPEAVIPDFFRSGEDAVFMGKFLDPKRKEQVDHQRIQEVLHVAKQESKDALLEGGDRRGGSGVMGGGPEGAAASPEEFHLREATPGDAETIAACYDTVFETYPFPIHDPGHIREEMKSGTKYFVAVEAGVLVAASAMEPGGAPGSVEMTDFATLPSCRGRGLATRLLTLMERTAQRAGRRTAFTIARAVSFGMNITFARRGYTFGGTLVNNTQIGGSIESMNVWYKPL